MSKKRREGGPFCDSKKAPAPLSSVSMHVIITTPRSTIVQAWPLSFELWVSRPGCCAGHGPAASYKSSVEFPDETLQFIKSHPLMDTAVPSIRDEPWFTKTRVRYDCGQYHTHKSLCFYLFFSKYFNFGDYKTLQNHTLLAIRPDSC